MPNRPEYMAAWIGITSAGGVAALINTNLVGTALAHCIDIVAPKHVVVAAELADEFATARALLKTQPKVWSHGESAEFPRLDREIDALPGDRLAASERAALTIEDRALYIYTSGTTGLPKAANINHYRVMLASQRLRRRDGHQAHRPHVRLPADVPHRRRARGDRLGAAQRRLGGDPREILRPRILGRRGAPRMHAVPVHRRAVPLSRAFAAESERNASTACGWPAATACGPTCGTEFKTRFRIPHILEFYGATEGNVNIFNFEGKQGAVGRVPWFVAHRFPIAVVRFDVEQPAAGAQRRGLLRALRRRTSRAR